MFVQTAPGVFEPREVVLSYQGPREVVVARGLEVGEQVVSENVLLLARQFRLAQDDAKPDGATGSAEKPPAAQTPPASAATKSVADPKK